MATIHSLDGFISSSDQVRTFQSLHDLFLSFLKAYAIDDFSVKRISKEEYEAQQELGCQKAIFTKEDFASRDLENALGALDCAKFKSEQCVVIFIYRPLGKIISIELFSFNKGEPFDRNILHILYAAANQFLIMQSRLSDEGSSILERHVELLTLREREVLLWAVRGKSKNEIAFILDVSESAIKRLIEAIFRKLGVNNLQLAISTALKKGLIQPY